VKNADRSPRFAARKRPYFFFEPPKKFVSERPILVKVVSSGLAFFGRRVLRTVVVEDRFARLEAFGKRILLQTAIATPREHARDFSCCITATEMRAHRCSQRFSGSNPQLEKSRLASEAWFHKRIPAQSKPGRESSPREKGLAGLGRGLGLDLLFAHGRRIDDCGVVFHFLFRRRVNNGRVFFHSRWSGAGAGVARVEEHGNTRGKEESFQISSSG